MTTQEKTKNIIRDLRKLIPEPKIALIYSNPWQLLVSVVLSAQTTDKKVNEVTKNLFKKYSDLDSYLTLDQADFENEIKQIGLFRGKAKNILATGRIIHDKYNDKIPNDMSKLIELPGIGRKTANILLSIIYDNQVGIAVDTHVKRLSLLWGLTKNQDPNKIEADLLKIVPRDDWEDFSNLVILYGRGYCPAHCKHLDCPLAKYIT
jgi:endonuclease-3